MNKLNIRLILIIYILFSLVSIGVASLFLTLFYFDAHDNLVENMSARVQSVVLSASEWIDADEHSVYRQSQDIEDPGYKSTVSSLRNLKATYIYTVSKDLQSNYYLIIDTDMEVEPVIGDLYMLSGDAEALFQSAFTDPGVVKSGKISDEYGTYITAVLGVKDSAGNVEMVIAADQDYSVVSRQRNFYVLIIAVLDSVLIIFFGLMGSVMISLLRKNNRMQRKIEGMAYYDSLTSLPNRISLMEKLRDMVNTCDANKNFSIGVFFIDLDNFKRVNDTEGHIAGDFLLQDVARFLSSHSANSLFVSRPGGGTKEFVARLGGDEFVMLCPTENITQTEMFVNGLLSDYRRMARDNDIIMKHSVTMSIGISFYPTQADDISTLLKNADIAMYKAKRAGKNSFYIFDSETDTPQ